MQSVIRRRSGHFSTIVGQNKKAPAESPQPMFACVWRRSLCASRWALKFFLISLCGAAQAHPFGPPGRRGVWGEGGEVCENYNGEILHLTSVWNFLLRSWYDFDLHLIRNWNKNTTVLKVCTGRLELHSKFPSDNKYLWNVWFCGLWPDPGYINFIWRLWMSVNDRQWQALNSKLTDLDGPRCENPSKSIIDGHFRQLILSLSELLYRKKCVDVFGDKGSLYLNS